MHLEHVAERLPRRFGGGRRPPSRVLRAAASCLAAAALLGPGAVAGQEVEELPLAPGITVGAVESERLYLSGTGPDDARGWEFRIDSGRLARQWRVIQVPSNWELQGFGRYTHGKQFWRPAEKAVYRRRFLAPWRLRAGRVELVFEGVMTDARVLLNGRGVGETHRGGFTRFAYDVSTMLRFGMSNLLEVQVAESSADASVNAAEREADYWTFGGIYRPVYLESHPPNSIAHLAVDARHDGRLRVDLEVAGPVAVKARLQVETLEGVPVGEPLTGPPGEAAARRIEGLLEGVEPWSAESPKLYRLRAELLRPGGEILHRRYLRFGFRTVEMRPGEGLFINGRRVLLKGVNRHSHWPDSGRAVPAAVNRRDVELIRSMNMNAVRTAHSPPDTEFLEACDELGLYVVDELPGWHDAYDTEVGARILGEMVRRDVNHPSVILWANGNEGGWNTELDPLFGRFDPQRRPVIHPGARGLGFEASHYPDWRELGRLVGGPEGAAAVSPAPVLLPTEILHALYDGGGGASLADYWRRLRSAAALGGAFIWSLFDEGVVRTDRDGEIDTSGNRGADGLLGPYRQPEGSYHAVRELWSPLRVAGHSFSAEMVEIELENRFDHTDLSECRLSWRWLRFPRFPEEGPEAAVGPGGQMPLPAAAPGAAAVVEIARPEAESESDAIELRAFAPDGRELMVWVLATASPDPVAAAWWASATGGDQPVRAERQDDRLLLRAAGGRWVRFDLETGTLEEMGHGERRLQLSGARRADGRHALLADLEVESRAGAAVVRARYEGALDELTWTFYDNGRLHLEYAFRGDEQDADYLGIGFDTPREGVKEITWLGLGPYRVWRNRQAGARLGVWRTAANDTVTGESWLYPEFAGFYGGVRWASLLTAQGRLTLAPDPGLFLGLFRPRFPSGARTAVAEMPEGITVLHQIAAIGTKFHAPDALGPAAGRRLSPGPRRGGLWLSFTGAGPEPRPAAAERPL